jgi:hypothetical protein
MVIVLLQTVVRRLSHCEYFKANKIKDKNPCFNVEERDICRLKVKDHNDN